MKRKIGSGGSSGKKTSSSNVFIKRMLFDYVKVMSIGVIFFILVGLNASFSTVPSPPYVYLSYLVFSIIFGIIIGDIIINVFMD